MNTPGNLGKTNPSRRLLAIEDDVDVQDIIKISLQLTRPDWDIWIAHSSNQGLRQAIELLPDALLLDINLPGENGFMTLNHLRADARTRGIPVVLLTAQRLVPWDTGKLGANGIIHKPFDPCTLAQQIETRLGWV
ncbi:MAG: response regulator [Synechococcales bacterium]|nr:response regulator [Cyanobacteria bacterium REEB444]MEB3126346.1 response regulator [Synechococcales bacterium]